MRASSTMAHQGGVLVVGLAHDLARDAGAADFRQRKGAGLARRAHQLDGKFIRHTSIISSRSAVVFLQFNGILEAKRLASFACTLDPS